MRQNVCLPDTLGQERLLYFHRRQTFNITQLITGGLFYPGVGPTTLTQEETLFPETST